jgi:hypothetical protein
MGREVRKVPPNWNHPTCEEGNRRGQPQPMFDRRFEDAAKLWKEGLANWEAGLRPAYVDGKEVWQTQDEWLYRDIGQEEHSSKEWWEYHGGPPEDRAYYRPWRDEEATWFQVWETVTEGTPVTPPFATKQELVEYLVANGDFWDQNRRARGVTDFECGAWKREDAERFVGIGWAPSMVMTNGAVTEVGGKKV